MALRRTGRHRRRVEPTDCLLSQREQREALYLWRTSNLTLEAIAERMGVAESVITRLVLREL